MSFYVTSSTFHEEIGAVAFADSTTVTAVGPTAVTTRRDRPPTATAVLVLAAANFTGTRPIVPPSPDRRTRSRDVAPRRFVPGIRPGAVRSHGTLKKICRVRIDISHCTSRIHMYHPHVCVCVCVGFDTRTRRRLPKTTSHPRLISRPLKRKKTKKRNQQKVYRPCAVEVRTTQQYP